MKNRRSKEVEELIARIIAEVEEADDGPIALDELLKRHPELTTDDADEIRALLAIKESLDKSVPDSNSAVPKQLGEYRILRQMARGGMGEIYEAIQEPIGRRVAVKTIRRGRLSGEARERFLREQKVLAQLHQTNIVPIHTAGTAGELDYFSMPYIGGATLHQVLNLLRERGDSSREFSTPGLGQLADLSSAEEPSAAHDRRQDEVAITSTFVVERTSSEFSQSGVKLKRIKLSTEYYRSVARVMADVGNAIDHAHGKGILHRDIKPSNIMVDTREQSWIIDFGLAGFVREEVTERMSDQAGFKLDAAVIVSGRLGTPQYMAPEQFDGRFDRQTDVWGLGVTLYELLTLNKPFVGESAAELQQAIRHKPAQRPRDAARGVPRDLESIALTAMQKRADARYASADEFVIDLRRWLAGEPTNARPARMPRRVWMWARRNKGWAAATLAVMLVVVSSLVIWRYEQIDKLQFVEDETERSLEAIKENRRESLFNELELARVRVASESRLHGWSELAWQSCREIRDQRVTDDLYEVVTIPITGLDAVWERSLPEPGSSLAFDKTGTRLLIGGVASDGPEQPTRIFDFETVGTTDGGLIRTGPVDFGDQQNALQFVKQDDTNYAIHSIETNQVVRTYRVPAHDEQVPVDRSSGEPVTTFLAATELAAASVNTAVFVWGVDPCAALHQFEGYATSLSFSPDGKYLACGYEDGRITIRELVDGTIVDNVPSGSVEIATLSFGHNYKVDRESAGKSDLKKWLLAAGDLGGSIKIWDMNMRYLTRCAGSLNRVTGLSFSPDGTLLASCGRSSPLVWDVGTGDQLLRLGSTNTMTDIKFSPDGQRIAVSSVPAHGAPGLVDIWKLQRRRGIQELRGLDSPPEQIVFDRHTRYLAVLCHDWSIGVWNVSSGLLVNRFATPAALYQDNAAIAISPDSQSLVFSGGRSARMWDIDSGTILKKWPELPEGLQDTLAFHSGRLLLMRCETQGKTKPPFSDNPWQVDPRVCRVRELLMDETWKELYEFDDMNIGVKDIEGADDGSFFVLEGKHSDEDGEKRSITVLDGPSGKVLWSTTSEKQSGSGRVRIDPSSRMICYETDDSGTSALVEFPGFHDVRPLPRLSHGLSPGAEFTALLKDPYCRIFPTQGEKQSLVVCRTDTISGDICRFSRDGRYVAAGTMNGVVMLCDLRRIRKQLEEIGLDWPAAN